MLGSAWPKAGNIVLAVETWLFIAVIWVVWSANIASADALSWPRVPSCPREPTTEPGRLRYGAMSNHRPFFPAPLYSLLKDLLAIVRLGLTSQAHLAAENLFLRKQLTLYQERRTKPRRPDPATRVTLVLLSRWLDWRALLTVVQPDTLIRWHRQGWRLFWRWKSRAGRPPIPADLQRADPHDGPREPDVRRGAYRGRTPAETGADRLAAYRWAGISSTCDPPAVVGPPNAGRHSCRTTRTRSSRVISSPRSRSASASCLCSSCSTVACHRGRTPSRS